MGKILVTSARVRRALSAAVLATVLLAPMARPQPISFYPTGDSISFWGTCTPPGLIWHAIADSSGVDRIVLYPYQCELVRGVPPDQVTARFDSAHFSIQDSLHENTYSLFWTSLADDTPRTYELHPDSLAWLDAGPFALTLGVWRGALRVDSMTVRGYSFQTGLSVDEEPGRLPREVSLYPNYPNPFNPITTIRYALPGPTRVTLALFNALGEHVTTLVQAEQGAGLHEVVLDGMNLASGAYVVRLAAGRTVQARTMILAR